MNSHRRPKKVGRWILVGMVVLAGGAIAARYLAASERPGAPAVLTSAPQRIVPVGTRIRVEVLNASGARGLARQATFALRDAGFDVVYYGNSSEVRDSSQVIDRLSHRAWANMAARALKPATVAFLPDSTRYVDLTVLVGRSWSPASQPFHP